MRDNAGQEGKLETAIGVPAPAQGISPKPWGIPAIVLGLALPVALWGSSLGIAIAEGGTDDLTDGQIATSFAFTIVLDIVLIGLAAGLALWRYRLGWPELGLRALDRRFVWYPVIAAAGAHVFIIVYSIVLEVARLSPPSQDLDQLFDSRAILPLAGVSTVIFAPIGEEIFFRGFIFGGLIRPLGLNGAMIASGLLFGLFHVTDANTFGLILPFGAIGMLFAWLYNRSGSLLTSIATHFLFNLVSFAVLAAFAGS